MSKYWNTMVLTFLLKALAGRHSSVHSMKTETLRHEAMDKGLSAWVVA